MKKARLITKQNVSKKSFFAIYAIKDQDKISFCPCQKVNTPILE